MTKPNLTIDEMAMKQLLSHKNDKSNRWLAKMNGSFGKVAADKAIKRNAEILKMCGITDVNNPVRSDFIKLRSSWDSQLIDDWRKSNKNAQDGVHKIQGFKCKYVVIDDFNESMWSNPE